MQNLDTNVLVRYLIKDDPRQHAAAAEVIESYIDDEGVFIPITVALELEWVLRSRYGVGKEEVIDTFSRLLETIGLWFQIEEALERAVSLYLESKADFADCLHLALSITDETLPLVTFDKQAAKLPNAVPP